MRHFDVRRLRREGGAANWALIICIVLLLVVVFLWWDTKSRLDDAETARAKAETAEKAQNELLVDREGRLDAISEVVGFRKDSSAGSGHAWTDIETLKGHLTPGGQVEGRPGVIDQMSNESFSTLTTKLT